MEAFFQNPWVVGIGGGVISGIIIYLFTRYLVKRKDNSEYIKNISRANVEVLQILKPYVVEDTGLPNVAIINAIIQSGARKYNVKVDEMFSIKMFCEELIKEMMESTFINLNMKEKYSNNIDNYIEELTVINEEEFKKQIEIESKFEIKRYKENYQGLVSSIIATIAAGVSSALLLSINDKNIFGSEFELTIIIASLSISATFLITLASWRQRRK